MDEQLIKAIMPFWDPSYRCFTFNQEDMVLTIEKYTALLCIETPNPNKVFLEKNERGRVRQKKMLQIMGLDITTIGQVKTMKGKSECLP